VHVARETNPDVTVRLAQFAASLRFQDVPQDVIGRVKWLLLDTLGVALAATALGSGCREVVDVMRKLGSKPESTIIGQRDKVSAPHAAFANGALAHALNYDAVGPRVGHIGVVCLAAPFAVAEALGGISGRHFLVAATVAAEVAARITAAVARDGRRLSEKILAGQLLSYFGAVAGAGRTLGLTAEQMRSAFGLALMQASGSMQVVVGGDPPAKAIYGAFPNHGGVLGALLAQAGLGADCDALEGRAGLFETYFEGDYDPCAMTDGLGTDYLLLGTRFKTCPTSDVVQPFVEAAMVIHGNGIASSKIEAVTICGPPHLRVWCEPIEMRHRPKNAAAAANSLPFCVAKTLSNGTLRLLDFSSEGLKEEMVLRIAGRTAYSGESATAATRLEVRMTDGHVLSSEVAAVRDDSCELVGYDRLLAKFRDCCRHAATPLSSEDVQQLIRSIESLDRLDQIGTILAITTGHSHSTA
jgi:2-methylcitrate dehydratase PrpD